MTIEVTPKLLEKDPDERLDYTWDWNKWLPTGDPIALATFSYLPDDGTLTIEPPSVNGGLVTVMISGGTLGKTYKVTCSARTVQGREPERSGLLHICEK